MAWIILRVALTVMVVAGCRHSKNVSSTAFSAIESPMATLPFHPIRSASDLDVLIDKIGSKRFVLMGEGSHGTAEFQTWRAELSKRLIVEKGFDVITIEGDWDEFIPVNEFLRLDSSQKKSAGNVLSKLKRWPTWLWQSDEFASFITWLRNLNQTRKEKISLYGMDLYGIGASLDAIRGKPTDSITSAKLKKVEACYLPYWDSALSYSTAVHKRVANCSASMQELKEAVYRLQKTGNKFEDFSLQQYAQTAFNGERYFRTIVYNTADSWNIRDRHFAETIERLLQLHGRNTKVIVWAHNSHVGDAAFTDMSQRGRTNLGELLRRKYGEQEVFILGFGTYAGKVMAAYKWNDSSHVMALPPAYKGSWEEVLHGIGNGDKLILSEDIRQSIPFNHWYDQRGVGVLYHPERPRSSYVPSFVSRRYDGFIFIDSSHEIHPIVHW